MKTIVNILCWFIPSREMRRQLRRKYAGGIIKYHSNNKIIVHLANGQKIINPKTVPGLKVKFNGKNSLIELFYPIRKISLMLLLLYRMTLYRILKGAILRLILFFIT